MEKYSLVDLIEYIDPRDLSYEEWLAVGMGLKDDGYSPDDWDRWSRKDIRRYHPGECHNKWESFRGEAGTKVTAGTIVQMAKDRGWQPDKGIALEWDAEIGGKDDLVVVEKEWLEGKEVFEPKIWKPAEQLIKYIETLFDSDENVGYVTESWEKDGKYLPRKGSYDRTAGQLIEQLGKCGDDLGAVLGDYKEAAGAWIRFNPLDGNGVKNENVTDYRYALIESDDMPIEEQNAIVRELELPVACLVHSGGKSLHAIVKVEARDYTEYRKRVDYLYDVCRKNGLKVDSQNRNPSRLSRMPGVIRKGRKQFLVDTNIGKESWDEWKEWIESVNDDLPDPESLMDTWDNLPELSPPLIEGVLRQGHKMLLAGPSKAGKSYALIELCVAIAEGKSWLGWQCAKGKVMYVNLELDRASCLHRFKDVYEAMMIKPSNLSNIDIWNLRGKSVPMDKLAPKLIRRAAKKDYIAIVIDPIYKVITGDENSADQMAHFCNQFDLVCNDLGAAVIYCHHHSKGGQGQKRSMDRASGSGVFARDPDALLDLIELDISEDLRAQKRNDFTCRACIDVLDKYSNTWEDHVSQDDMCSASQMKKACDKHLLGEGAQEADKAIKMAEKRAEALTAWRIEGTLREFPKFPPVNLWFNYPAHIVDHVGVLQDVQPDKPFYEKGKAARKKQSEKQREEKLRKYNMAIENFKFEHEDQYPTVKELYEEMKSDAEAVGDKYPAEKTIRNSLKDIGYCIEKGTGRICPAPEES